MRLLIVGDLCGYFSKASQIATANGAKVRIAADIETALSTLRSGKGADLLMVDVKLNIEHLINELSKEHIAVPVVACGIENNRELAVKAIRAGAKEYVPLPPDEKLISAILEAISDDNRQVLYKSQAMHNVINIANQIASTDATILLTGKSGTGKEVLSRYIHNHSKRKDKAFISVNCAAIPENLLESELFGHEKGAFTGAIARRIGKFEESSNGTLLLDEISEIDIRLQAKLLRAIQEQEIDRVGGSAPVKLNLRIIATSNRDLKKEVAAGRFREDLYFRLNVINIELPTLAERKDDIELFAKYFVEKYCKSNNLQIKSISNEIIDKLKSYDWPGNIREFENTIYRAVLLSPDNFISESSLQILKNHTSSNFIEKTIFDVEKEHIINTLNYYIGDQTKAANILGISLQSLKDKMKKYEIEHELS